MNAGLDFLRTHAEAENWFLCRSNALIRMNRSLFPRRYRDCYGLHEPPRLNWPVYCRLTDQLKPDELDDLRKEYAALITMCDAYLGKILDFMDEQDLWKDTR